MTTRLVQTTGDVLPGERQSGVRLTSGDGSTPSALVRDLGDPVLAAEGPGDHIRNGLMLLGALRRVLPVCGRRHADAFALVEAISARLEKALQQVESP